MNLYADVIIDITNESLDRPFTYRVPDTLSVCPGQMVKVPFGRTIRKGYVIALKEKTTLEEGKIKEISQVVTGAMNIEAELLSLAIWMHEYYGCTLNRALSVVMPVKSRVQHKVERQITLKITNQALLDCIKECERKKRYAWLRVLAAFASTDLLDYKEAITKLGVTKVVLDKMEKEDLIYRKQSTKDKRKKNVFLTDKGKFLESKSKIVTDKMDEIFYKGFSESEIEMFENMLRKIIVNMEDGYDK